MACDPEFIDFVSSQLNGAGTIRARRMFGDWMIYVDEKPVVMAFDNLCYVKMHPAIGGLMSDAATGFPYPGAKPHYILDIEHRDVVLSIVRSLLPYIHYAKRKK
ncbi:MAG: transcriptional regulator [Muribaculaceae bacterium]